MPKLEVLITLLVNRDHVRLILIDNLSGLTFFKADVPGPDFLDMMARLSNVPVTADVMNIHNIGKKLVTDKLTFPMPPHSYDDRKTVAFTEALKHCPNGWEVDNYFGSQNSFYMEDIIEYCRATIRKYVDIDNEPRTITV